jgi:hypothetical protein
VPDEQDEGDHHAGAAEDRPPVAPVDVRIDQCRGDERDGAHARIEDLAVEEVGRVVRKVELREARDAPESDEHERRHADEQDPVERAGDAEDARRLALGVQPCPL